MLSYDQTVRYVCCCISYGMDGKSKNERERMYIEKSEVNGMYM